MLTSRIMTPVRRADYGALLLEMFHDTLPRMEEVLVDVKAPSRAPEAGTMAGEDPARIASKIACIDVIPSYPPVFGGYNELIATGRLRQLDDTVMIDLPGDQSAECEAAQAVVGYRRGGIQGTSDAFDQNVQIS